jgi:hypothetical protein
MKKPKVRRLWTTALLIALAWQLVMTLLGIFLERSFSPTDPASMTTLSHTGYWDGGWFRSIIAGDGYVLSAPSAVFYPLFPMAVTAVQFLSFHALSLTAAALIVNTATLWLAIVALARIAEHFVDSKYRWLVVTLFITSPAAIFMHFVYAEAIFCALAFWAYLFALRRQWWHMAVLLCLIAIVKVPALLVIGLCGLEFMRAHQWSVRKMLNRQALAFVLVPLGFIGYGIYLQRIRGDFLAMFHAYEYTDDWGYHVFDPNFLMPIFSAFKTTILLLLGKTAGISVELANNALPFVGLLLLALASFYAVFYIRGKALPLSITGFVSIVFFTINSNVISVHRYLLPCLVLYLVPVVLLQKYKNLSWAVYAAILAGCVLQVILFFFFVSGRFAG